tara:strand:- start:1494 stop:3365 length:1872 start_codon:yes stop_codon:yes gene_type:complete
MAQAYGGTGTKSFGQQQLRLGRSESLADFARNLQSQTTGNLRRATESKMMGLTSSALGFLPGFAQASMYGMLSSPFARGTSSPVSRVQSSGSPGQNTLWMSNLERLFKEPLPVKIISDPLAFIEAKRENAPKIIEGTSKRVGSEERAKGFDLKSLGLMGLGGLIIAAMTKLRDYIEGLELDSSEWFTQLLPDDLLGDGLSLGSTILASLGVASLARTLIFGSPSGKDGKGPRKGGLLRGLRAVLLNQFRSIAWVKALTGFKFGAGSAFAGLGIAAAMSKIGFSVLPIIFDGIAGYFKAEEWDTSKFSAIVGAALGGTSSGGVGALTGAVKGGFAGMAIGSIFPGPGNIIGFLIGSILGAVLGYFGGERIAKMMDAIGKEADSILDSAKNPENWINPSGIGAMRWPGDSKGYRMDRKGMDEGAFMYKNDMDNPNYDPSNVPLSFIFKQKYSVPVEKYYASMSDTDRKLIEDISGLTIKELVDNGYYIFPPSRINAEIMKKLNINPADLENYTRPMKEEDFYKKNPDFWDKFFNPYESGIFRSDPDDNFEGTFLPNPAKSLENGMMLGWNSSLMNSPGYGGNSSSPVFVDNSSPSHITTGGHSFNFNVSSSATDLMGLKLKLNYG